MAVRAIAPAKAAMIPAPTAARCRTAPPAPERTRAQTPVPTPSPWTNRYCACGGICPRCVCSPGLRETDISGVRIHPSAPEITAPLRARAVTIGQDIYFDPGHYRPGTAAGDALIAHELAHTLQTRRDEANSPGAGAPGDTWSPKRGRPPSAEVLEGNADDLARGATDRVLAAPPNAVLCSPLDTESAAERTRRLALVRSIRNAIARNLELLQTHGLLRGVEVAVERGGVRGVSRVGAMPDDFESYAQRDARVRRVTQALMGMAARYEVAPVPADFSGPAAVEDGFFESSVPHPPGSGTSEAVFLADVPEWADLQAAYERHRIAWGLTSSEYDLDGFYLNPADLVEPGAAPGAPGLRGAVSSSARLVVPDVERNPLRTWLLSGTAPIPEGSIVVEVMHDDFGYYYMHRSVRIDVPNPWSR